MTTLLNLILIPLFSQGLWCSNSACSTCLQGYKYKNFMCISNCPTGYTASSGNCELIGSLALFNFTPGLSLPFNAKSVDVFHHPQGL